MRHAETAAEAPDEEEEEEEVPHDDKEEVEEEEKEKKKGEETPDRRAGLDSIQSLIAGCAGCVCR